MAPVAAAPAAPLVLLVAVDARDGGGGGVSAAWVVLLVALLATTEPSNSATANPRSHSATHRAMSMRHTRANSAATLESCMVNVAVPWQEPPARKLCTRRYTGDVGWHDGDTTLPLMRDCRRARVLALRRRPTAWSAAPAAAAAPARKCARVRALSGGRDGRRGGDVCAGLRGTRGDGGSSRPRPCVLLLLAFGL